LPSLKAIRFCRASSLVVFAASLASVSSVLLGSFGCGGVGAPDGSRAASSSIGIPVVSRPSSIGRSRLNREGQTDNSKSVLADLGSSLFSFRANSGSASRGVAPGSTLEQLIAGTNGGEGRVGRPENGLCPPDMASIGDRYCVDRFEGSLVEMLPDGSERPWSPFTGMEGHEVRAVSQAGVYPQGYISEKQAKQACQASGKRLCKAAEWKAACMGPEKTTYPYGNDDEPRRCNDHGKSPIAARLKEGRETGDPIAWSWSWDRMNDEALNQYEGTLARSGDHEGCTNGYGVYDMVGNLHEWVDDSSGTFLGGYYQDTHQNGDGCGYKTMAHEAWYHDYSTGFRCCADVDQ
jgi:hypothetical protein